MGPMGGFVEGASGPGNRHRVVSAVIVVAEEVEVAGIVHDSIIQPLWSSRRPPAGLPRSLGCLPRLWRW